jgi:hypothetical protein
MATITVNLTDLVSAKVDLISGRSFGESEAEKNLVLDHIKNQDKMVILVNDQYVKAINDSFIKGFFSKVFSELKTKEKVKEYFEIRANDYFIRLFDKNWTVLEALYNNTASPASVN